MKHQVITPILLGKLKKKTTPKKRLIIFYGYERLGMKYRIVIRNILNKRVTPLTIFFDTKEYALQRMKESYTSELANNLIYDLQTDEETEKNEA